MSEREEACGSRIIRSPFVLCIAPTGHVFTSYRNLFKVSLHLVLDCVLVHFFVHAQMVKLTLFLHTLFFDGTETQQLSVFRISQPTSKLRWCCLRCACPSTVCWRDFLMRTRKQKLFLALTCKYLYNVYQHVAPCYDIEQFLQRLLVLSFAISWHHHPADMNFYMC